jgi:hypothetical protein
LGIFNQTILRQPKLAHIIAIEFEGESLTAAKQAMKGHVAFLGGYAELGRN